MRDLVAARIEAEVTRLAVELGPVVALAEDAAEPPELDPTPTHVVAAALDPTTVSVEQWPFTLVVPQRLSSLARTDVADSGGRLYVARYPVQVMLFARGDGYENTAAVRDRMVLAHRELLLRWASLDAGSAFEVDEGTLVETYSPVGNDETLGATVAAGIIDVEVVVGEVLAPARPPVGTVATTQIAAGLLSDTLSAHPAL